MFNPCVIQKRFLCGHGLTFHPFLTPPSVPYEWWKPESWTLCVPSSLQLGWHQPRFHLAEAPTWCWKADVGSGRQQLLWSSAQAPASLAARASHGVSAGTALCCAWLFLLVTLFLVVEGSCLVPWHFLWAI